MKKFLFLVLVSLPAMAHQICQDPLSYYKQNIFFISDYDDTIKVANTAGSKTSIFTRSMFTDLFYAGTRRLYSTFRAGTPSEKSNITIVSASPKWIRAKIKDDLKDNFFPKHTLSLRDWVSDRDSFQYKVTVISEKVKELESIILIGDDTEKDPEVFSYIQELFPKKIKAIYIRKILGRKIPTTQKHFFTSFDLAVNEYLEGRMSLENAHAVGMAVFSESKIKALVPPFVFNSVAISECLKIESDYFKTSTLFGLCLKIQKRLDKIILN